MRHIILLALATILLTIYLITALTFVNMLVNAGYIQGL